MIVLEHIDQLSPEWFALRAGVPSASRFSDIVTTKGVRSKSAKKYLYTLAGEKITGEKSGIFQSDYMQRGMDLEEEARNFYEIVSGEDVKQVGLVYQDEKRLYSCSPDGLMEGKGIEIKCPSMAVHVEYLLAGKLPTTYFAQVQGAMLITGFEKWDFMSYYPGMPSLMITVERDDVFCDKLESELIGFCEDLEEVTERLREL